MKFKEYLIVRDPELYQQLLAEAWGRDLALAATLVPGAFYGLHQITEPIAKPIAHYLYHPERQYSKNEILLKKQVIPSALIRSAQKNPEKWDKDLANIQQPGSQDIGFATHKDFFDKPVTMYVVKEKAMERVKPDAGAYASFNGDYIVVPKSAFIELPTATSDGKLTKSGSDILAHELRHTTQKGDVPRERWQNQKGSTSTPEGYHQYMHDPKEMGVRLAAIKNLLDENLMKKTQEEFIRNLKARKILNSSFKREPIDDQEFNKLLNSYPKNEKDLLMFILDPDMYFANKIQNNLQLGNKTKIIQQEFVYISHTIKEMVREMNRDARSLINFYIDLDSSQKQNYMKELLDNYDQVVKDQPFSRMKPKELNPQWTT